LSVITVKQLYADLVPELTSQEYESLRQSIKNKGYWKSKPIIRSPDGIIYDGHNRWKICQELGIEPTFTVMSFDNQLEEKLFVIESNLKRRQLTIAQKVELAHTLKPIYEEKARQNQSLAGKLYGKSRKTDSYVSNDTQLSPIGRVNALVAKEVGLSSTSTYDRGETVLEQSPELWDKVKKGKMSIYKAYKRHTNDQDRQRLIDTKPVIDLTENKQLYHGDLRVKGKEIRDNSTDLLFTDPFYANEYLYLYRDIGSLAFRVLKPGGSLVLFGAYDLPRSMNLILESGLKFIDDIPVIHSGACGMDWPNHIRRKHKTLLWFVKGTKPNTVGIFEDVIYSETPDKSLHEMAQSPVETEYVISKLTVENQIVLDPMMGSGTTGIAALNLKRQFIGIEIDKNKFEIAEANISRHLHQGDV
jgi:ParB-like chromosome segregation protein Spo0J